MRSFKKTGPRSVATLLPPIEDYVPGNTFQGTRDVRVVNRARTLQVATWLHHLDMLARGDVMASQTLEAMQHSQGLLLDLFLTPMMSSLTLKEVVNCILNKNQHGAKSSLDDLWGTVVGFMGSWMTSPRFMERSLTSPHKRGSRRILT